MASSAMTLTAWINLRDAPPTTGDVLFSDEFLFAPAADNGWALRIGEAVRQHQPTLRRQLCADVQCADLHGNRLRQRPSAYRTPFPPMVSGSSSH